MSENQRQHYFRGRIGLPTSSTPTTTTTTTTAVAGAVMTSGSGASTSPQVLTFPLGNTAVFAPMSPHLLPHTAGAAVMSPHLPLSFVAPSGQVFLSSPVPLSPSLPFISTACLLPHPQMNTRQLGGLTFPFGIPSTVNLSQAQQPSTPLSVSNPEILTSTLQSPRVMESTPALITSQAQISKPISTTKDRQPLSVKSLSFAQSPVAPTRLSPQQAYPSLPPEQTSSLHPDQASSSSSSSSSTISRARPLINEPQKQSKEPGTLTGGSLKKLLVSSPEQPSSRDPLREELAGERDLTLFYQCFLSSSQSQHLHIEVLPSQGNLKWLQVRQKVFHIDPDLGPVVIARILVSSNGILKLQLLYPIYKTVFTKLFVEQEIEDVLSELSLDHVICPGLPNYADKFSVLGYHPSHVRIFESPHVKRYDHEHCPIWHVPTGTFSKRDRTAQKMCKQCKYLQNSVVRLATKACEVDPAERESWTNPSSNRPLAYMSAADREERYRKLRQERNQMLVKLRAYEERLGIGELGTIFVNFCPWGSVSLSALLLWRLNSVNGSWS